MFKKTAGKIALLGIIITIISALFFWEFTEADMPQQFFFQAKLTKKDGTTLSGAHNVTLRLYTASSGGSALWTETQSLTADASGIVSCYLGGTTSFPSTMDFNSTYYLSIEVDSDGEMSPRIKIVPSLAALNSDRFDGLNSTQFLRSDTADTMEAAFTLTSYLDQDYTGTAADALNINFNPASGSYDALDITYGSAGGTGTALKVTQSGTGDILQLYDGSTGVFFIKDGGNVGIGTTTPGYKLQVAGDIDTSSGTFRMAGVDYGPYFIDSQGTTGQVWKSDGAGRGAWGTDTDTDTDIYWTGTATNLVAATGRTSLGLVIGTDVQAYDADLTTYAGITPSANIQTFLGSADYATARSNLGAQSTLTNSAGLLAALSDETGTGLAVFGTSPTFTTSIIDPLVYGGVAANDDLTLEGTSHATKTTSYVILQPTSGNVGIGTTSPGALLDLGLAGTTLGVVRLAGSTSGNVSLQPNAIAGAGIVLTLPATTGTLVTGGGTASGTNTGDNTVATTGDSATSFFSTGTLEVAIGGTGTTTSTGTGSVVLGTSPTFTTSIAIPQGTAPTVDAAGEIAVDTTDDQLVYYGAAKRVIPYECTRCGSLENLSSTDDNISLGMWGDAVTITGIACSYIGTGTTPATITLEDGSGNAMTITGTNPTCVAHGTNATFAAVTAGNSLVAGEILRFDVTDTAPASDDYTICIKYTYDAQ